MSVWEVKLERTN